MENPSLDHLKAAKQVWRYKKGTLSLGLRYKKSEKFQLIGYFDSDYAGDLLDRTSS